MRSKPSRSARKLERERRSRAVEHGLPIAEPQPSRRVIETEPVPFCAVHVGAVDNGLGATRASVEVIRWRERWSRVPLSIRLLGAGIFALIAIGLYRRYTEDREVYPTEAESRFLVVPTVPAIPAMVPTVPAMVPTVATTANSAVPGTLSLKTATERKIRAIATTKPPTTGSTEKATTSVNALPVSPDNPY